jgi:hypothetical protein
MDLMFEQIGNVYNKKEQWRINLAEQHIEAANQVLDVAEFTQYNK